MVESLPHPADHAFDAVKDTDGFLSKCPLQLHVKLLINTSKSSTRGLVSTHSSVYVLGNAPDSDTEPHTIGHVKLHEVHTGPHLKPFKVSHGIPSLLHVNHTTQFCAVHSSLKISMLTTQTKKLLKAMHSNVLVTMCICLKMN